MKTPAKKGQTTADGPGFVEIPDSQKKTRNQNPERQTLDVMDNRTQGVKTGTRKLNVVQAQIYKHMKATLESKGGRDGPSIYKRRRFQEFSRLLFPGNHR